MGTMTAEARISSDCRSTNNKSSQQIPKAWPRSFPYLTTPIFSPNLSRSQLTILHNPPPSDTSSSAKTFSEGHSSQEPFIIIPSTQLLHANRLVRITPILDPNHPACGQCGLFAAEHLKPGSFIIAYLGIIHSTSSSKEDGQEDVETKLHNASDYDLSLSRDAEIAVDAERAGNESRFINDYRGVKEKENALWRDVWVDRGNHKSGKRGYWTVGVFVKERSKEAKGKGKDKGIRKGDEILVSYGKGFWGARRQQDLVDGSSEKQGA